jgi:excisionase family DNA binding protein
LCFFGIFYRVGNVYFQRGGRRFFPPEIIFWRGLDLETYLNIEGLAEYLKLSVQTIRRWVLNREVPFHKIKKVIRFRLSEIEQWVESGGKGVLAAADETAVCGVQDVSEGGEIPLPCDDDRRESV